MTIFVEIGGVLEPGAVGPLTSQGRLVLSTLASGESEMAPPSSMGLAYVASGVEIYRFNGRAFPVAAGQFLVVPHGFSGEVAIGRCPDGPALGLCVSMPSTATVREMNLDQPMVFPAPCSSLGRTLASAHSRVRRNRSEGKAVASPLLGVLGGEIETLLEETLRTLGGLSGLKAATRYETLRRLNVARSYLHAVTDHAVDLVELSRVAGISRFQLLRSFRDAFGAPPAAYHRRLRLELAKAHIDGEQLSCWEAAQRFGFADSSSFSHAYRRTFGTSPQRTRISLGR